MGGVGGGQLDGGKLDRLGGGGDGGGDGTMETIAVDSGSVDVVDWPGHKRVVAVLRLLQLDQLGVGGGVGLNRLEGGGLVLDGLLGDSGHGVHRAEAETIASIDELGSPSGDGAGGGEDNKELHGRLVKYKTPA